MAVTTLGNVEVRIVGYKDGKFQINTSPKPPATGKQKHVLINKAEYMKSKSKVKHKAGEFPYATTIIARQIAADNVKFLIGFNTASILILDVSLEKNGTPQYKHINFISLAGETKPVTAITILDNARFAIALGNNKIKIVAFTTSMSDPKANYNIALDKNNPMIPLSVPHTAAAILTQDTPPDPAMHYVYVLAASGQLSLFKFDKNLSHIGTTTVPITDNVAQLATPTDGSNTLVYAKFSGAIFQTSPRMSTPPQQINTSGANLAAGIHIMTFSNSMLYVITKDSKLATILITRGDTDYDAIPKDPIGGGLPQPPLVDLSFDNEDKDGAPPPLPAPAAQYATVGELFGVQPLRSFTLPASSSQPMVVPHDLRSHASTTTYKPTLYGSMPAQESHYSPLPGSGPSQQRVPRTVVTNTGDRFLMFSKDAIAEPGESKAKLVLCQKLNPDGSVEKFAVAKKFDTEAELLKELGDYKDWMATMPGRIRNYGWVEVKARHGGQERAQKKYYLLIEHMGQGNLLHLRDFFNTNNIDIATRCSILQPFVSNLLSGLQQGFHGKGKYHLDIKPDNVMLKYLFKNSTREYTLADLINKQLEAKLVDFGESIAAPDGNINHGSGDSRYFSFQRLALYRFLKAFGASPLAGDLNRSFYLGNAEDAWMLGVVCLEVLIGYNPFVDGVKNEVGATITLGSKDYGIGERARTCSLKYFNDIIYALNEQYKWFNAPKAFPNPDNYNLLQLIKSLVNMDENQRISALQSGIRNYGKMPSRPAQPPYVPDNYAHTPPPPSSSSATTSGNPFLDQAWNPEAYPSDLNPFETPEEKFGDNNPFA